MSFSNSRREGFLNSIPTVSLEAAENDLTTRCKFNFSYFTVAGGSQDFSEWDHGQLCKLLKAMKEYTTKSLLYWQNERSGKGKVLAIYGGFPLKSDFTHPAHVPHEAVWGRFRLQSAVRLVGFVVPGDMHGRVQRKGSDSVFDCNTFYIVFLDANHRFYLTETR